MSLVNGGQAFPQVTGGHVEAPEGSSHNNLRLKTAGGMSLRDYFAGQALSGVFQEAITDVHDRTLARRCYELADAMLVERAKATDV